MLNYDVDHRYVLFRAMGMEDYIPTVWGDMLAPSETYLKRLQQLRTPICLLNNYLLEAFDSFLRDIFVSHYPAGSTFNCLHVLSSSDAKAWNAWALSNQGSLSTASAQGFVGAPYINPKHKTKRLVFLGEQDGSRFTWSTKHMSLPFWGYILRQGAVDHSSDEDNQSTSSDDDEDWTTRRGQASKTPSSAVEQSPKERRTVVKVDSSTKRRSLLVSPESLQKKTRNSVYYKDSPRSGDSSASPSEKKKNRKRKRKRKTKRPFHIPTAIPTHIAEEYETHCKNIVQYGDSLADAFGSIDTTWHAFALTQQTSLLQTILRLFKRLVTALPVNIGHTKKEFGTTSDDKYYVVTNAKMTIINALLSSNAFHSEERLEIVCTLCGFGRRIFSGGNPPARVNTMCEFGRFGSPPTQLAARNQVLACVLSRAYAGTMSPAQTRLSSLERTLGIEPEEAWSASMGYGLQHLIRALPHFERCSFVTGPMQDAYHSSWVNVLNRLAPQLIENESDIKDGKVVVIGGNLGGSVAALTNVVIEIRNMLNMSCAWQTTKQVFRDMKEDTDKVCKALIAASVDESRASHVVLTHCYSFRQFSSRMQAILTGSEYNKQLQERNSLATEEQRINFIATMQADMKFLLEDQPATQQEVLDTLVCRIDETLLAALAFHCFTSFRNVNIYDSFHCKLLLPSLCVLVPPQVSRARRCQPPASQ
eukprot:COSAG01_NODE_7695_length_3095_cov_6.943258_2_plen_703_part_00